MALHPSPRPGWEGSFYPKGMRSRDFLSYYAKQFQTVEIDSTFYGTPSASTVASWKDKTPPDFVFAVNAPQVIIYPRSGFSRRKIRAAHR